MRPLIVLFFSLVCSVACGQIKLVETVSESNEIWSGLISPVVNADGTITSAPGSKPVLTAPSIKASRYSFSTAVEYQFKLLKVKRVGTGEKVSTEREKDSEVYWFPPGVPAGKYEFNYTVFDATKGIDSEDFVVDYKPVIRPPVVDPPGPIVPPTPDVPLTGAAAEARKAMADYVLRMAADMRTGAKEIRSNQLKTTPQVQIRGKALDMATRVYWQEKIGAIMNTYSVEPPTADMYESIATGYEAVVK